MTRQDRGSLRKLIAETNGYLARHEFAACDAILERIERDALWRWAGAADRTSIAKLAVFHDCAERARRLLALIDRASVLCPQCGELTHLDEFSASMRTPPVGEFKGVEPCDHCGHLINYS